MAVDALIAGVRKEIMTLARKADEMVRKTVSAQQLARHYLTVRELYDDVGELGKQIGELKRKMAEELVPQAFERDGITTVTLAEGFRVTTSARVLASTRDMARGIEWMRANGFQDIVKETINASTLSALAKDLGSRNEELPAELFNVYVGNNTSITKTK